jgi:hypothetical protein
MRSSCGAVVLDWDFNNRHHCRIRDGRIFLPENGRLLRGVFYDVRKRCLGRQGGVFGLWVCCVGRGVG